MLTIELSLVLRYVSLHTDVLGNAGIVSHILNLGIRWKWAVSLTLWPLYLLGLGTWYLLKRRPAVSSNWSKAWNQTLMYNRTACNLVRSRRVVPPWKYRSGWPTLHTCRWKDNIKRDLQDVGWKGMGWIDLAQNRDRWRALVNAVVNLRVQ